MSKTDCPIEAALLTAGAYINATRDHADALRDYVQGRPSDLLAAAKHLDAQTTELKHKLAAARAELAEKNAEIARLRECVRLADEMARAYRGCALSLSDRGKVAPLAVAYRAARRQS